MASSATRSILQSCTAETTSTTGSFTLAGAGSGGHMTTARSGATATLITGSGTSLDGKVLITGGSSWQYVPGAVDSAAGMRSVRTGGAEHCGDLRPSGRHLHRDRIDSGMRGGNGASDLHHRTAFDLRWDCKLRLRPQLKAERL